jgi:formylglycine-generating enzyme required for sulfatase activity
MQRQETKKQAQAADLVNAFAEIQKQQEAETARLAKLKQQQEAESARLAREKAAASFSPKPEEPVAPMDAKLWAVCWNQEQGYFDFTHNDWVTLPHDKQFAYAQAYQAWYAKSKGRDPAKTLRKNNVDFAFCLIPPGKFWMGSPDGEADRSSDEKRHRVLISKPFYIGKYEVTQVQWLAVMDKNPSGFKDDMKKPTGLPVECMLWENCQDFCNKASMMLPTEAQWEYACRAGTTTPFNLGENITTVQVNYDGKYPYNKAAKGEYRHKTVPVGSLPNQNAWGCYDFHGNVWEWCADSCDWKSGVVTDTYVDEAKDPLCTTGSIRVVRGGGWDRLALYCRSADRSGLEPRSRDTFVGLRLVLSSNFNP